MYLYLLSYKRILIFYLIIKFFIKMILFSY
nr:MAG TPA: hypothetical protein [Caudoviricetes sp.]